MTLELGSTGKKIIHKAQLLLQERGYQFFSFQDLADSVGIRKASVHHYFKSKEELARMMIVDYRVRLQAWADEIDSRSMNHRQKLQAYFEMFSALSKNGKNVCPGGSLLLDWNNFSKSIQGELQELLKLHHRWLTKLLEEAIALKASPLKSSEISGHVLLIGSSIQGGLQLARANVDSEKFLRQLFKQIDRITFERTDL